MNIDDIDDIIFDFDEALTNNLFCLNQDEVVSVALIRADGLVFN